MHRDEHYAIYNDFKALLQQEKELLQQEEFTLWENSLIQSGKPEIAGNMKLESQIPSSDLT